MVAAQQKAGPVRTCLGCGTKAPKTAFIRFVFLDGGLLIDRKQVAPGRGAYCCRKMECYHRFVRQQKKLAWALRCHEKDKMVSIAPRQGLDVEFASCLV